MHVQIPKCSVYPLEDMCMRLMNEVDFQIIHKIRIYRPMQIFKKGSTNDDFSEKLIFQEILKNQLTFHGSVTRKPG